LVVEGEIFGWGGGGLGFGCLRGDEEKRDGWGFAVGVLIWMGMVLGVRGWGMMGGGVSFGVVVFSGLCIYGVCRVVMVGGGGVFW